MKIELNELPYELNLALSGILGTEDKMGDVENQWALLALYKGGPMRLDEITECFESSQGLVEQTLRSLQSRLLVYTYYEDGFEEINHFYCITPFGKRLLDALLEALFIVVPKPRGE